MWGVISRKTSGKGKRAEDLLTSLLRELLEESDDLGEGFSFELRGIRSSGDFGMRTTDVSGNVFSVIGLTADAALYDSWH